MRDLIKKIIKEETVDNNSMDMRVLNFLKRRFNFEVKDLSLGEDEKPLIVKTLSFNLGDDWYTLNSFMPKKEMVFKIINMMEDNDVISLGGYNPNILNTDRQRVVRTIKHFLDNTILKKD